MSVLGEVENSSTMEGSSRCRFGGSEDVMIPHDGRCRCHGLLRIVIYWGYKNGNYFRDKPLIGSTPTLHDKSSPTENLQLKWPFVS